MIIVGRVKSYYEDELNACVCVSYLPVFMIHPVVHTSPQICISFPGPGRLKKLDTLRIMFQLEMILFLLAFVTQEICNLKYGRRPVIVSANIL